MSFVPGTRLGPYEITGPLGAGGMGEVYRATDTNLKRTVAIKVLPEAVATDGERLARFQREAEVLARLNHPNIAAIYGLEKRDGTAALVMELVEGPTLADRIAQGPIPVEDALPIAKQIAEAVEAAHDQGIIHRDLKPANVKVREDGTVKVLDFGLAKALEPVAGGSPDGTASPTITSPAMMTRVGVMLGTAAYMSPEQAKGRLADKRSDIWAFGCVLFEMLTGERAFPGDDVAETLAAVLKTEPDWSELPADTPPLARRLVQRCLEKNVSARVPDIAVALFELSEPATAWPTTNATAAPLRRTRWLIAAASLAAALASAVGVWLWLRPDGSATSPAPVTRLALVPPPGVQFVDVLYPLAITPDGRRIVFVGEKNGVRQFYVRSLDSLDAQLIPGTDGIDPRVTLSPDGQSLLTFDLRNRMLKKVPIDGGTAESICQLPGAALGVVRGASWGRGGNIVFAMEPEPGLMIVRDTGGVAQPLTTATEGEVHGRPQFLPDGKHLLFAGKGALSVVNIDTREVRSVMPTPFGQYVASGHLLFLREGTLWVVKFDMNTLQPIGDVSPLSDAISFIVPGGPARMSVSDDGTLVYIVGSGVPSRATRESSLMLVDTAQGRESPLPNIPPGPYGFIRISPTGDKIAVGTNPGAAARVAVYDTRRSVMTPITTDTRSGRPLWADRETLVFEQMRGGAAAVYSQRADGTGQATLVWTENVGGWTYAPNALLPDGRLIVSKARLGSYGIYREQDLLLVTPGNAAATRLLASTDNEANGVVSRNGEWIAYESDRTGRYEVWVERFPQMTDRQPVSTDGGASPVWSIDGKRLFYMTNDGRQVFEVQVSSQQGQGLTVSKPRLRVQGDYFPPFWGYRRFDVMPDGNQFVLLKPAVDNRGTPLEVVVVDGWFDELRQRLP